MTANKYSDFGGEENENTKLKIKKIVYYIRLSRVTYLLYLIQYSSLLLRNEILRITNIANAVVSK